MFKRRRLSRLSALGADTASQRRAATESVFCLLPDVDPVWLATAFDAYPSSKPADAASHIVDKLLDMRGGHPSVARAPSGKGKGRAADSEDWDEQLATINRDLALLSDMAPNVELGFLRDLLTSEPHSRLFGALDYLVSQRIYGVVPPPRIDAGEPLAATQLVRARPYQRAVQDRLTKRFLGVVDTRHIGAVLRQKNYDYVACETELLRMAGDPAFAPWRVFHTIRRLFTRPGPPIGDRDWRSEREAELRRELLAIDVAGRAAEDEARARQLNTTEAERSGATLECGCCYALLAGEDCVACPDGHVVCRDCLRRGVEEAAHGTSRSDGIRCLSSEGDDCRFDYADALLGRVLAPDLYAALQRRAADAALDAALRAAPGMTVVRCAYCCNAALNRQGGPWRSLWASAPAVTLALAPLLALLHVALLLIMLLLPPLLVSSTTSRLPPLKQNPLRLPANPVCILVEPARAAGLVADYLTYVWRIATTERHSVFRCPCRRATCMLCERGWYAGHECADASNGLRLAVERAMSEAVKRTCQRCSLAFVKDEGCNKMTCRCGNTICYICGQDGVGYSHFCQCFRERPGEACTWCDKCDVYKAPNEAELVRVAAAQARADWLAAHDGEPSAGSAHGPPRGGARPPVLPPALCR